MNVKSSGPPNTNSIMLVQVRKSSQEKTWPSASGARDYPLHRLTNPFAACRVLNLLAALTRATRLDTAAFPPSPADAIREYHQLSGCRGKNAHGPYFPLACQGCVTQGAPSGSVPWFGSTSLGERGFRPASRLTYRQRRPRFPPIRLATSPLGKASLVSFRRSCS